MTFRAFRNVSSKALVCAVAVTALAGCATHPKPDAPPPPTNVLEHYKAEVTDVPDQLALGVHASGLSDHQKEALADFVNRWRDAEGGRVVLKLPADAVDAAHAKSMTFAVQTQLERLGVPSENIHLETYAAGAANGPVLASFTRLDAKGPSCAGGWDNLTSTMDNEPYGHFGCALTANIAAQVADPRDLDHPTGLSPADNARREVVIGKYRQGKITSTDKDSQANGATSAAITQ